MWFLPTSGQRNAVCAECWLALRHILGVCTIVAFYFTIIFCNRTKRRAFFCFLQGKVRAAADTQSGKNVGNKDSRRLSFTSSDKSTTQHHPRQRRKENNYVSGALWCFHRGNAEDKSLHFLLFISSLVHRT